MTQYHQSGNGLNYSAPSAVAGTTFYNLILTDAGSGCGSALSNAVSVLVVSQPTVRLRPISVICIGGTSTITATTNGSGSFLINGKPVQMDLRGQYRNQQSTIL
jgi:hypothetical protein